MKIDEFLTFLGTKNLKTTSEFYQNVLRLELYKDQGLCKIFNVTKGSKIGFCSCIPVIYKKNCPILTFIIENVDNIYQKLVNIGVKVPEPPKLNQKFKIYHFFFQDPNGCTIEIQKFLD